MGDDLKIMSKQIKPKFVQTKKRDQFFKITFFGSDFTAFVDFPVFSVFFVKKLATALSWGFFGFVFISDFVDFPASDFGTIIAARPVFPRVKNRNFAQKSLTRN